MALRKTLAQRLLNITKVSSQTLTNCRISSSAVIGRVSISPRATDTDDPGDNGLFRSPQFAGTLLRKLRDMDISRNRIRWEGLTPPPPQTQTQTQTRGGMEEGGNVAEARKLLKVVQFEIVKSKLRGTRKSYITFSEFIRICMENCPDQDQALEIAQRLDDSAAVIVLGDVVFLRPEQVAKAIQGLLPVPGAKVHESERKELEEMEKKKLSIDDRANSMVRRELWGGLGFLMVQTMAFMRLTFWELTWDVMEPICFYLTSMYFMAGYTFFLRTSREPSFEGFYQARFSSKQRRLMKLKNFDIERYHQLRAAFSPKFDNSSKQH
ncbi:calcium uniporter protein 2, mitochondrial [Cajanus cajan]|uniref:Coiled-coil domain-containing protein 109A family n=1 Tax=Cajanus cajan TaxID=3821 RepID=A0A151TI58_CAJCA|nr:calcium uniporter protein 2, mitochondrial [Cajanus cajan]KYP66712.1 Coiled-coil domain-containing protein 109A family [Cajanus cajan]